MSDGLQDMGAVATAGLAAREMERARGGGSHAGHPGNCANCNTALTGAFCHACGQNGHVHRTAAAFFHDVAHGVFHFEGKVWHTLPMLAWRPGELTRRYIDGERVRFVSPMALFLFSVFLMFASLGLWGHGPDIGGRRSVTTIQSDLGSRQAELTAKIAKLKQRRARAIAEQDREDVADYDVRLAEAGRQATVVASARRTLGGAVTVGSSDDEPGNFNLGVKSLDDKLRHATENPELTLYKLKTAAYKYSWALIPISLPFIWLMFPFSRRFGFYDHAIFATYSLSFMTLLVVVASVTMWAGVATGLVALALWLIPPVHIYRQLKGTYLLGRRGALVRTAVMLVFSLFTLILFGLLLGYLGLA